ncbi:cb27798f-838e-4cbf-b0df-89cd4318de08 [Sclerotinia trifoliorum]|uniref:Cb27798f-838e-4cbf-b0df-89cd4318de08 n=1 Tax=Sclerotinia trifoliorum TaxID=28548 RepID=A0A8H2ZM10_9HELO|nr:cb27798f-838e-4cbf-b0df-89cd4318de08 [Sclerotinia trifoliorum]
MVSLKEHQHQHNSSLPEISISNITRPSSLVSMTTLSSVSNADEDPGLPVYQCYSMQNEDGPWSDSSLSSLPSSPSDTASPPPTSPKATPSSRINRNTRTLVPTSGKPWSALPRKKTAAASARKFRQPAAPKTRKPVAKTKELPSLENANLGKPEAWGQPEVWAEKRQQLCSSLPYHRGHESAAYRTNGMVAGFLANQGIGPRDVFTEDIYITGVGGGKEKGEDGETKQVKDQNVSLIAISFQHTMEAKLPVAIIAGGLKVCKARMEKIDLKKRSWWSPVNSVAHLSQGYDGVKTLVQTCHDCNTSCKTIYTHGWTCRSPQCRSFYVFYHQVDVNDLQYCGDFMQERTPYIGAPPPPLRPEPVTDTDLVGEDVFGVEERCKQGIVCAKFHGCIRRLEWHQWTCETVGCDFTHTVTQIPVPLSKVLSATDFIADKIPLDFVHESIGVNQKPIGHYDVYELKIPGPARHPGLPIEIGAPYKFLVAHEANSFQNAPPPILKAMQRMTWAGKQAFAGKEDVEFTPLNEVLCLGYFENMHIGYHDDGEDTLGETVATLSLGASSTMCFRPKNKSTIGGIHKTNKGSKTSKKDYAKLTLNHGDIIIMHGSGIHKYYEATRRQAPWTPEICTYLPIRQA